MRVAGVNVKSGQVFIAAVDQAQSEGLGVAVPGAGIRLGLNSGLDDASGLADLRDRVKQQLRTWGVEAVGLVATRSYTGWKYRDAYARILPVCGVMLASAELSLPYEELKTAAIGKTVLASPANLKAVDPAAFGFEAPPKYWTTGLAEAYCAAATLSAKASKK